MTQVEEIFDDLTDVDIDEMVLDAYIGEVRELSLHEVKSHKLMGPAHIGLRPLEKIRATHHVLARMVAIGLSHRDIAERIGCSMQHITNLTNHSESFKDLVISYQNRMTEEMMSHAGRLHFAAGLALELVTDDLLEKGDSLAPAFKLKAMESLLDRSGYGAKSQAHVFHHAGLQKEDIRAMKAESLAKEMPHYDTSSRELSAGPHPAAAGAVSAALQEGPPSGGESRISEVVEGETASQCEDEGSDAEAAGGNQVPDQSSGDASQ